MKIALVAPLLYPLSENSSGGIETFVYLLARILSQRGHQVDLYSVGDSHVHSHLIQVIEKGLWGQYTKPAEEVNWELATTWKTFAMLGQHIQEYDIVHNNQLNFLALQKTAGLDHTLTTLHLPVDSLPITIVREIAPQLLENNFVAISAYQQQQASDINFRAKIYNGIQLSDFTFNLNPDHSLAWLGRIEPRKGLETAITAAKNTMTPLRVAGSIWHQDYFEEIGPLLRNEPVSFLGEADKSLREELLSQARALLFPIHWEEPFGLVVIEAMACGTPVITFDRGAMSELIIDGVTGFICPPDDISAMEKAIKTITTMPDNQYRQMRQACRARVEEYFTIERMVDQYEVLYAKIASENQQ